MSAAGFSTIEVEGLQETLRAFGRIEKGLRKELRKELVEIAGVVAVRAREIAEEKGLHESGALISRIHPGMRSTYAYVTDTARRKSRKYPEGFNYPAIYEYGGSQTRRVAGVDYGISNRSKQGAAIKAKYGHGSGHLGARAFLEPAAEQENEKAVAMVEGMLDRLTSQAGFGRGGVL